MSTLIGKMQKADLVILAVRNLQDAAARYTDATGQIFESNDMASAWDDLLNAIGDFDNA